LLSSFSTEVGASVSGNMIFFNYLKLNATLLDEVLTMEAGSEGKVLALTNVAEPEPHFLKNLFCGEAGAE